MKTTIAPPKKSRFFWMFILIFMSLSPVFLTFNSCKKDLVQLEKDEAGINISESIKSGSSNASTSVLYYGHEIFTRSNGQPVVVTKSITNPNYLHYDAPYYLIVKNGTGQNNRVSSGVIKIDGVQIIGPSDFSQNVDTIVKVINGLTPTSVLSVELRGKPGGCIDLWIDGFLKPGHALITSAGGKFSLLNGEVTMSIPQGAIDSNLYISVTNIYDSLTPEIKQYLTQAYEFLPDGQIFNDFVEVKIKLPTNINSDQIPVCFGHFSLVTGYFFWNGCAYNEQDQTVSFDLNHFSLWGGTGPGSKLDPNKNYKYEISNFPSLPPSTITVPNINSHYASEIERSFKRWNAYSKFTNINFVRLSTDSDITIEFLTPLQADDKYLTTTEFPNNFAGKVIRNLFTGKFVIVLNDEEVWEPTIRLTRFYAGSVFNIERTLTHEIGHLFALNEEYKIYFWQTEPNNYKSVMGKKYQSLPMSILDYDINNLVSRYNITYIPYDFADDLIPYPNELSTTQNFITGQTVTDALRVKVVDQNNVGIPGVTVVYYSLYSQNQTHPLETATDPVTYSDNEGFATINSWLLPDTPGQYIIKAKAWLEPNQNNGTDDDLLEEVTFTVNVTASNNTTYFSDDFSSGNYNQWTFFKYSSGLYGNVPDPYINNGRLFITTHDQQSTFLNTGLSSWQNYTLEYDAKIETPLEDAYRGIYTWVYTNNLHYNPQNQQISADAYFLNMCGRNQTWSLSRSFQQESGTNSITLSSGTTSIQVGVNYHIKIRVQNNNIKVYFNQQGSAEVLLADVNVSSSILSGGSIGIGGSDDIISIDNVLVTAN